MAQNKGDSGGAGSEFSQLTQLLIDMVNNAEDDGYVDELAPKAIALVRSGKISAEQLNQSIPGCGRPIELAEEIGRQELIDVLVARGAKMDTGAGSKSKGAPPDAGRAFLDAMMAAASGKRGAGQADDDESDDDEGEYDDDEDGDYDAGGPPSSGVGIMDLTQATNGWTLCAFRAPCETISAVLSKRPDVLEYHPKVDYLPLAQARGVRPGEDRRDAYLFQAVESSWTILVRTVHWAAPADCQLVHALAKELSASLKIAAVSGSHDDFASPELRVFDKGKLVVEANERDEDSDYDEQWSAFEEYSGESGFYAPNCFISNDGGPPTFHTDVELSRVDHFVFRV